ncbi:hypothetical protein MKX03_013615, partial [Papaver bracteatum]
MEGRRKYERRSKEQLEALEAAYISSGGSVPELDQRRSLGEELKLPLPKVNSWFTNRAKKDKPSGSGSGSQKVRTTMTTTTLVHFASSTYVGNIQRPMSSTRVPDRGQDTRDVNNLLKIAAFLANPSAELPSAAVLDKWKQEIISSKTKGLSVDWIMERWIELERRSRIAHLMETLEKIESDIFEFTSARSEARSRAAELSEKIEQARAVHAQKTRLLRLAEEELHSTS